MINLGIIGTGMISRNFVATAEKTNEFKLTAVYSRTEERAKEFGEPFGAQNFFTDLNKFFESEVFSTVYIASPNDLHFQQVKQAILNHKNVIVEKPAFSNPNEMKQIITLLQAHPEVCFFEAARTIHEPSFAAIKEKLGTMKTIQGASLTYQKYSSRYDAFLEGKNPNIFTLKHSAGALQDLGVYLVYDAVGWFGVPEEVHYFPVKLENGIDGSGIAILKYPHFQVELNIGKTSNSYLPSEIYGLKDTIVMDNAADLNEVKWVDDQRNAHSIGQPMENHLISEIKDFAKIINDPNKDLNRQLRKQWLQLAIQVNRVLYELRLSAGIRFDADELK